MVAQPKKRRWRLWLGIVIATPVVGLVLAVVLLLAAGPLLEATEDHWEQGLEYGMSAAEAAQDADSQQDWETVAQYWTSAVVELRQAEGPEVATKLAEYESNLEVAQLRVQEFKDLEREVASTENQAKRTEAVDTLEAYSTTIRSLDPDSALFVDISLDAADSDLNTLVVQVAPGWHYQPKAARLEAATNLWEGWATLRAPEEPDTARLRLEDSNGRQVGGSRVIAGSVVYVDD
ncbi:MAG: hypothetical protein AAF609_05635 [Cyanobacteria bacterium P01_C01_bin.120]